jgi:hypothetical protein
VFVTTWLGYGMNQAWERYVAQAINIFESDRSKNLEYSAEVFTPTPEFPRLSSHPTPFPSSFTCL